MKGEVMPRQKNKSSFLTQGIVLAAASVIVRLIGLIYRIPLTRIIGDDGNGAYSNAFEVYNIALLLSTYSIPTAMSKLISEREDKKEYRNSTHLLQVAIIFAAAIGAVASLLLFFGANLISGVIYKEADFSTAIPLRVLAPTIFVFSVMGVIRGYFQGKHTVLPTSVSQIFEQIVNAVVSVVAAQYFIKKYSASEKVSAYGAAGGTLGTLSGALVAFLFLGFLLLAYVPYLKKKVKRDKHENVEENGALLRILLYTMIPIVLNQTVYSLSSFLDSFLMNQIFAYKGISEAERRIMFGRYSGKYRLLTNVPIAIASAIGMAVIPSVVQAHISKDKELLHNRIAQAVKLNMLIAFPCAGGLCALAEPIMYAIFADSGEALSMTSRMMYIGALSVVFFAYSTTTNSILQGVGLLKKPVLHGVISLAVYLVVDILLLAFSPFGVYSLVIGNMLFPLLISIMNYFTLKKELDYKQEVERTFIRIALCTGFMSVLSLICYRGCLFLCKSAKLSLVVAIPFAVILYFVLAIGFRAVTEDELLDLPKGTLLVKIAKKLHLM